MVGTRHGHGLQLRMSSILTRYKLDFVYYNIICVVYVVFIVLSVYPMQRPERG